jgi:hypothetical protein
MTKDKTPEPGIAAYLIAAVLILLVLIPTAAYFGWAVSTLWGWFVVPLGVPAVNIWEAAGLFTLARFLTHDDRDRAEPPKRTAKERNLRLVSILLAPLLLVALGALYHGLA